MDTKKISKFLSLVLRHDPGRIGIELDPHGWTDCGHLIDAACRNGIRLDHALLVEIVRSSDKQRFALSDDQTRVRANQGHSVEVDLSLKPVTPPAVLFHGTVDKFIPSIRETGIEKGQRHHVHLSPDIDTASKVGERRGKPVILKVGAKRMHASGREFFLSGNGVWLTDHVPAEFIDFGMKTTVLYRPVGPKELKLIEESGWTAFPPRLPDQPIFYPVTNEPYAIQIARDWNVKASGSGFVTKFHVESVYLDKYPVQIVGGREHTELWVPAEELEEFNHHIMGKIVVTKRFPQDGQDGFNTALKPEIL